MPICLDLLWEFTRSGDRPINPDPDHPFRIITDIAAYQPGKPLWSNWAALEAIRRWLSQPNVWDRQYTPLDVLDSLLQKAGIEHGQMTPDSASSVPPEYESIRELREAVLNTLDGCLSSEDLRAVLRSVRSLGAGLNGPMPFLNMSFTSADLRQWEPGRLRIIAMLGRLNERNPHPLVSLAELRAVRNQALYGHIDVVKERAAALVRSIGQSFDFRLTRILLPEMSRWDFFEEDAGKNPVAERQERYGAFARSVAAETWERFPDPVTVVMELDRRMREIPAP